LKTKELVNLHGSHPSDKNKGVARVGHPVHLFGRS